MELVNDNSDNMTYDHLKRWVDIVKKEEAEKEQINANK